MFTWHLLHGMGGICNCYSVHSLHITIRIQAHQLFGAGELATSACYLLACYKMLLSLVSHTHGEAALCLCSQLHAVLHGANMACMSPGEKQEKIVNPHPPEIIASRLEP